MKPPGRSFPRAGDGAALALALGAVVFLLALTDAVGAYVPHTFIKRDARFYTNVNVTLVEDGSVDQSDWARSWYERDLGWNRSIDVAWSNVALGREGNRVPKHPILMPVLSTPLYWAFGLPGLLLFNLLCFGAAGAGAFAFARRYASPGSAALAAAAFLMATGVRSHVYDYHVDVLLLALWLGGLAALHARRGLLAGVLVAGAVMLKPTTIALAPAAALLARPDRKTFGWAILGGALALGGWSIKNWWVFGRPWWTGYTRTLIVEGGETVLAEGDVFSVPLQEGLRNLWSGPYGLRHRMPLALVALGSLLLLIRRRPVAVLGVLATAVGIGVLFATYLWYGDRFLWPALALGLPGLALLFDALGRGARVHRDVARVTLATALIAAVSLLAHHAPQATTLEAWLGIAMLAALAGVTTVAAQRVVSGPAALVAPVALVLFGGVLQSSLAPTADLPFALLLMAALATRRVWVALAFATSAALVLMWQTDLAALEPVPGEGRAAAIWLGVALLGSAWMGRHALMLLPLALLAWPAMRALGQPLPLFAIALGSLALPAATRRLSLAAVDGWRGTSASRRALAVVAPLLALGVFGAVDRLRAEPFRLGSAAGVRQAQVRLGHVPCDFLAWEHFNWECASYDRGVHGEVGLMTSSPVHIGSEPASMLMISAPGGRDRHVRWEDLPARPTLVLQVAVPDEARGGGTLSVLLDGELRETIPLPTRPDGRVATHRFDTGRREGTVTLELVLEARGSSVLVDGHLE